MNDEGPGCGTAAALTRLAVAYSCQGVMHVIETMHCCYRHIPRPCDVLPADAEILEVVIADSLTRTRVADGEVTITPCR